MYPTHPLFCIIVFIIAFGTAYLIRLKYKPTVTASRYESIDGLRGFLALGVFIHHATIWYVLLHTGQWVTPESNLYYHLGETSVNLFFMITSFLFVSKLINSAEKEFDWVKFFRSRIFRIAPMYYFSLLITILLVFIASQFQLLTSWGELFTSITHWIFFTINGTYKINNFEFTAFVNSAVVWSLAYEWLFYFSLPLIAIFILRKKPNIIFLLISASFIVFFYLEHGIVHYYLYAFFGGAIPPVLLKFSFFQKIKDIYLSIIIVVALAFIGQFYTTQNEWCMLCIVILFNCVALGGTLLGLLKNNTLKFLGEICYSTYLLHGILLFILFYLLLGMDKSFLLSPFQFCISIFILTPVVVIISFLGYRFIEKPFMDKGKR